MSLKKWKFDYYHFIGSLPIVTLISTPEIIPKLKLIERQLISATG